MLNKDLEKKMKKVINEEFGKPSIKFENEGYKPIDFKTMKFSPEAHELFQLLKSKDLTASYIKKNGDDISILIYDPDFRVANRKQILFKLLSSINDSVSSINDSPVDVDGYYELVIKKMLKENLTNEAKYWLINIPYNGQATLPIINSTEPKVYAPEVSSLFHTGMIDMGLPVYFRDKASVEEVTKEIYDNAMEAVKKKKNSPIKLVEAEEKTEKKEEPKKDEIDKALDIKDTAKSVKKLKTIKFSKLKAKMTELKIKKKNVNKPSEKKVIEKKVEKIETALEKPVKEDVKTAAWIANNAVSDMHESKKTKKELTLKESIQLKLKKMKQK